MLFRSVVAAIDAVIEKGRRVAAHVLEAAEADIAYRGGVFEIAGTDRHIALFELADRARALARAGEIPEDLDTRCTADVPPSFPNGVHVAEVEIEPDTGRVNLAAYTAVDDCGRVLQPVLVEGQVQGGVAQGVGQALLENVVYDSETGQLLSGSFLDYAMPRANDMPPIGTEFDQSLPTRFNKLGAKGVGESGTHGAIPAVVNAVIDALATYGVRHVDMPLTSEKLWRAINER